MAKGLKYLLLMLLLILGCVHLPTRPEDCAGVEGGTAVVDDCGTCDADTSNDCIQDCAGIWGGTAELDNCNVCDAVSSNDNTTCTQDCAGTWGGDAYIEDENCFISDIDGNVYETIQIGGQLWMAENLKVTHYNDGDEIPTGYSDEEWWGLQTGAYAVYDDDPSNADIYGNLYNWAVVGDDRGVCPEGFHVPSDEEFMELEMEIGMSEEEANDTGSRGTDEGSKLAGNSDLWNDGALVSNSEFGTSGFTALPAGRRSNSWGQGYYERMGTIGPFWSSSEHNSDYAYYRSLSYYYSYVVRTNFDKQFGLSIRCLGD